MYNLIFIRNFEAPVVYEFHVGDIHSAWKIANDLENMGNENDVMIDVDVMSFESMQDMNMWLRVEVERVMVK